MLKSIFLGLALVAASHAQADFGLASGCGSTAAHMTTAKLESEYPTWGSWTIQEFKTIIQYNKFEFLMSANGSLQNDEDSRTYPCARVTVSGHMGATDCKIKPEDIKVEMLQPVQYGLCK
jgi:hypothetical protein